MCYGSQLLTSTSLHLQGCTLGFVVMGWGLGEPQAHPRIHLLGFSLSLSKISHSWTIPPPTGSVSPLIPEMVLARPLQVWEEQLSLRIQVPACPQGPASSPFMPRMRKLSCPPTRQITSPPSASVQLQVPKSEENNDTEWGRDIIIMSSSTARGSSQSSQRRRQGCFHVRGLHL